jgi:hypothetical protein
MALRGHTEANENEASDERTFDLELFSREDRHRRFWTLGFAEPPPRRRLSESAVGQVRQTFS